MEGLQAAQDGQGPLLQRDYWAVIAGCHVRPSEIIEDIGRRFCEYAPPDLVVFERAGQENNGAAGHGAGGDGSGSRALQVGDELAVRIRMAGEYRVRVVCRQPQSLTLATLAGHPEAGRITFGAYRNQRGEVIFHIRSRARSGSQAHYLGYLVAGEPMQMNTWTDFIKTVALTFGTGPAGAVHAQTRTLPEDEHDDEQALCSPTFLAEGD